jgi:hypothetical protein
MAIIATNSVHIARFANALYGVQLGSITNAAVQGDITAAGGLDNALNAYYAYSFGGMTTAKVTSTILTNLGLVAGQNGLTQAAVDNASAYIVATLNAAAPNARGAAVKTILNLWANIADDANLGATYGAAATAWDTTVASAQAYTLSNALDISVAAGSKIGQTFTLSLGTDTIVGAAGDDTINGSDTTYTGLDNIDGGAGNNSLVLSDVAGSIDLSKATVKNVQAFKLSSTAGLFGAAGDVSGWTGLTSANLSLKSAAVQTVTAADTTAVTVSNTAGATVVGGSAVNVATGSAAAAVTQAAASAALQVAVAAAADNAAVQLLTTAAVTAGTITAAQKTTIDGAATVALSATAVGTIATANAAAVAAYNVTATNNKALASATVKNGNVVTITDGSTNSDQLKSVSLDGNAGAATLTGKALTSVTIANTAQSTTITNALTGGHAQSVTLTNVTGGTVQDATATSVAVTTATTKSSGVTLSAAAATSVSINAAVDLSLTALTANVATGVTVAGAGKVTIAGATVGALTSIDASSNTGGVVVTPGLAVGVAFTGGSGKDSISIGATTKAIATGAGDDTVTVTAAAGTAGTVDAGLGTDTLSGTSAVISAFVAADAAKYTGFETLSISDALANAASFDVTGFTGVTNFTAAAGVTAGATAHAVLGANAVVTMAGPLQTNTGALEFAMKTNTTSDAATLVINSDYTDNNDTAADAVARTATVTATSIESLTVQSTGKMGTITPVTGYKADVVTNTLALTDTALTTLTVTGDKALSFTSGAGMTKLGTVDASANTGGATINVSAAATDGTAAALTVKGSATAANALTGSGNADVIVGGSAADVITGGAKGDTLTGNGGNDTFVFAAGDSVIGVGTFDTITDFVANTYGAGTAGAVDTHGAYGVLSTKLTGDLIQVTHVGAAATDTVKVYVAANAADASTFLQNNKGATIVGVALDASTGNLYIDNVGGDGVADLYIHLTGVTTINAAAILLV